MIEVTEAPSRRRAVNVGPLAVGGGPPVVIAGPCSVEHDYPAHARAVAATGVDALRACIYKPRTRPDSFQGLGAEALPLLAEARRATGLPLVTEVMSPEDAERIHGAVDAFQVGARNMQNVRLLEALGEMGHPVVLKRGLAATVDEWLASAEYITRRGNHQVILCERGIRTFETRTRNTLDLSSVVVLRELSQLPVIVDPSHAAGQGRWVPALAAAALAVGADGLLVEAHPDPRGAWTDAAQAVDLEACRALVATARLHRDSGERSIDDARLTIDAIDAEIAGLAARRRSVAHAIQARRAAEGGAARDGGREDAVHGRYRAALGPDGDRMAEAVLAVSRLGALATG